MTAKDYAERAQKEALAKEGKGETWLEGFEVRNAVVQVELDQEVRMSIESSAHFFESVLFHGRESFFSGS